MKVIFNNTSANYDPTIGNAEIPFNARASIGNTNTGSFRAEGYVPRRGHRKAVDFVRTQNDLDHEEDINSNTCNFSMLKQSQFRGQIVTNLSYKTNS